MFWSEALTLAHTTSNLHRRFCKVVDGFRAFLVTSQRITLWSEGAAHVHDNRACMHHTMSWPILYVHTANTCTFVHLGGNVKQVVAAPHLAVCTCQAGAKCLCPHGSI